jgi:hypothetical protein
MLCYGFTLTLLYNRSNILLMAPKGGSTPSPPTSPCRKKENIGPAGLNPRNPDSVTDDTLGPEAPTLEEIMPNVQQTNVHKMHLKPNHCIPKVAKTPVYEIFSLKLGGYVQHMKYHALIGKFLGLFPNEKD